MKLAQVYVYIGLVIIGYSDVAFGAMSRVAIPAASVVQKRLSQAGFPGFIEQAEVLRGLTGKREHPLRVALAVELACDAYYHVMTLDMDEQGVCKVGKEVSTLKPSVFEALLKDNPVTLDILKRRGMCRFSGGNVQT